MSFIFLLTEIYLKENFLKFRSNNFFFSDVKTAKYASIAVSRATRPDCCYVRIVMYPSTLTVLLLL